MGDYELHRSGEPHDPQRPFGRRHIAHPVPCSVPGHVLLSGNCVCLRGYRRKLALRSRGWHGLELVLALWLGREVGHVARRGPRMLLRTGDVVRGFGHERHRELRAGRPSFIVEVIHHSGHWGVPGFRRIPAHGADRKERCNDGGIGRHHAAIVVLSLDVDGVDGRTLRPWHEGRYDHGHHLHGVGLACSRPAGCPAVRRRQRRRRRRLGGRWGARSRLVAPRLWCGCGAAAGLHGLCLLHALHRGFRHRRRAARHRPAGRALGS
mmetsp:Transcript_107684/g.309995  ORF Transcript_107684/g.309995 Transcript_107684/m.309995 type:complete len:265 (-) Transcript_107684:626-1420(-)